MAPDCTEVDVHGGEETEKIGTVSNRHVLLLFLFFKAADGIRDLVRSRGLGDVYKRQDYPGICLP